MVIPVTQFSIPFQPLLAKVTRCLEFADPQYTVVSLEHSSFSVTVKCTYKPEEYVYVGGFSTNLEESREKAARLAIRDLIVKFDIYIPDFTAAKIQAYERCANLWRLKQEEVKCLRKGLSRIPLLEEFVCNEICHLHSVTLDMVSILVAITRELHILCSSIITLEHTPLSFTSWLTINSSNAEHEPVCIFSDVAMSTVASQQNLAHKAIQYLTLIYNIDIIDANYAPEEVRFAALIYECARNKFINLEKHMLQIQRGLLDTPVLDEDDCTTPKGAAHSIPLLPCPPPPPKKQKTRQTLPPISVHVPALEKMDPSPSPEYDSNSLYKYARLT